MNPIMKRCLASSLAIHGVGLMIFCSGLFHPGPIRLGTTYGVEYLGQMGGGGGGNGLPAPAPTPAPKAEEEAKPTPKARADESTWGLKKTRKTRRPAQAAKKITAPQKQAAPAKKSGVQTTAAPAQAGTATGVEGGQGEGIGIGVGSGAGPGKGTGSGGFPYSWYLVSVKAKLWREWSRWAGSSQPHNCVVTFSIQRDGSVEKVSLRQSSGDPFYDQMAVRSVNYSTPFPPLPEGYGQGDLELYVEFKFLAGD